MSDNPRFQHPEPDPPPAPAPPPHKRVARLVQSAIREYDLAKRNLTPDQSIVMMCFIGDKEFEALQVGYNDDDIVMVRARSKEGSCVLIQPVEQVTLAVIVVNKPAEKPPAFVGFHHFDDLNP